MVGWRWRDIPPPVGAPTGCHSQPVTGRSNSTASSRSRSRSADKSSIITSLLVVGGGTPPAITGGVGALSVAIPQRDELLVEGMQPGEFGVDFGQAALDDHVGVPTGAGAAGP